jgi:hypothetical protein
MMIRPIQIQGTSGIHVGFNYGAPGGLVLALVNDIDRSRDQQQILAEAGINAGQGLRLLAGFIEAALGIHGRNLLAAAEDIDDRPLVGSSWDCRPACRTGRPGCTGPTLILSPKAISFSTSLLNGVPEDSDDDQGDAEVDDVAAVAARVSVAEAASWRRSDSGQLLPAMTRPPRRNSETTVKLTSAASAAAMVA